MNASVKFLISLTFITLAACSTQEVKQAATPPPNNTTSIQDRSSTAATETEPVSGQSPPMTIMKGDKKLNLVKIMDGGICKNEYQGATGAFLLYADTKDIERIKSEKGVAAFKTFETKIQDLSADVLQEAIDKTNLSEDPFALGEDEAQQKLATKLINNFRDAAVSAVKTFKQETTLTIDITAFPPSLIFYQKGCEANHIDPEKTESDNQLNANY
ncbi:MAG: hypothetical protein WCP01_08700 [Methylococcaceae bacterium]